MNATKTSADDGRTDDQTTDDGPDVITLADLKGHQAGELERGTEIAVEYTITEHYGPDRRHTIRGELRGIDWKEYEGSNGTREECIITFRDDDYSRRKVIVTEFGTMVRTDYPNADKNQTLGSGEVTITCPETGRIEAETLTPEGSTIRLRGEYRNCRMFEVVEVVSESGDVSRIVESAGLEATRVYNHMVVPFTDGDGNELCGSEVSD